MLFRKLSLLSIYYVPGNDGTKYFECHYVMQIKTIYEYDLFMIWFSF